LKKRKEFSLEPLDLGNFYHSVLDALVKRLNKEQKDIAAIEKDAILQLLREEIEKYIKVSSFLSNFINRRLYNEFIITSACETLKDFVTAMTQMVRAGSFRPYVSEIAFGHVKNNSVNIGDFEKEMSDGRIISLSGKIDRLDVAQNDNEKTAIVFDYKTSVTKFNWSKFYHALDLQLPVYMLAARNAAGSKFGRVIGAFFIPVDVSTPAAAISEIEAKKEKYDYKANGIFDGSYYQRLDNTLNSGRSKFYNFAYTSGDGQYGYYSSSGSLKPDDFDKVLDFAGRKIIKLAGEIFSGKIEVRPYRLNNLSPCNNCEFLSVCRFDWQINDYHNLESLNKTKVLENIGGGNG
jgi:ATP-dependent helicase/nuclease subunit B